MEKWFGRLFGFLLVFSLLSVNPINIYADELELVDGESVEDIEKIEENVDLDNNISITFHKYHLFLDSFLTI